MLSSEDSRRLAQLERQLLRDDPDFCARMTAGQPSATARSHRRAPAALIAATAVLWLAAIILGVLTWWVPAIMTALAATLTAAALAHRLIRSKPPATG